MCVIACRALLARRIEKLLFEQVSPSSQAAQDAFTLGVCARRTSMSQDVYTKCIQMYHLENKCSSFSVYQIINLKARIAVAIEDLKDVNIVNNLACRRSTESS